MKEHVQKPGVRKWAGEDLLELQGETLTALQALVEPYAPCIIQGCGVGQTDGVYQVQPGIVALKGSNEDGNACTKIVRFAGYTGEVLPIYLTIKVTPYMRVYADEENKPIAYEYTAEAFTNEPADIPYLKIDASGGSRLVDTIGITQKLDREGGNASNVKVVSFKEDTAAGRINISAGMTMKELFGRIYRWLRDLGALAFKEKVEKSDFKDELKTEFNNKVDKDGNKVLSTNDFTNAMRDKLKDIEAGAEVNVQADWSVTDTKSDAFIKNKPTASNIGGKLPIANGGTGETTATAAAGALLNGLGTGNAIPADNANIIISGNGTTTYYRKPLALLWNWIKSKLKTVATTGSYNDLTDTPTVGNGKITIKQAGTTKGSFSVNQNGDTTIELTDNNTVYTHPTNAGYKHIPSGGSVNQYLKYTSSGTAEWASLPKISSQPGIDLLAGMLGLHLTMILRVDMTHYESEASIGVNIRNESDGQVLVQMNPRYVETPKVGVKKFRLIATEMYLYGHFAWIPIVGCGKASVYVDSITKSGSTKNITYNVYFEDDYRGAVQIYWLVFAVDPI